MKRFYFDYAATTPVDSEVLRAMKPYFSKKFGNPGSLHFFGQEAMAAVDEAREKISKVIGADFREVVFTGSATEANNLALRGVVKNLRKLQAGAFRNQNSFSPAEKLSFPSANRPAEGGSQADSPAGHSSKHRAFRQNFSPLKIIVSEIEHESILETARDLEKKGIQVFYLPVDKKGSVDIKKLEAELDENTALISVMHANNEIGSIQPIQKISKIIQNFRDSSHSSFPLFHSDAVQAFQFLDTNANNLGGDLMTLSAHKIYGPKGVGALYKRNYQLPTTNDLRPMVTGGGQEFGLRSGTENTPLIVGFAKAIELAAKNKEKERKRIFELKKYFWKELKKIYPKAEANVSPDDFKNYLPNILNVCFNNVEAQDLMIKLDLNGIAVSMGSACSTRAYKQSHVLKALGLSDKKIASSLRFSFGKFTTKKEIDSALKIIKMVFKK